MIKVQNLLTDMTMLMKAYGQTTDANAGLLRESWGNGSHTSKIAVNSTEEYGWKKTSQKTTEFVPVHYGETFSPAQSAAVLGE